MDIISCTSWEN